MAGEMISLSSAKRCFVRIFIGIRKTFRNQNQNFEPSLSLCFIGILKEATNEPTHGRVVPGTCPIGDAPQSHNHCQHKYMDTSSGH
jgi:hypothetical protein